VSITKILVTGAGGFIGGYTVRYLERVTGVPVIAGTRDGRAGSCQFDVQDVAGMTEALAGVSTVVHCAVGNRAVTVDGTRDLLRAAAKAGVRRVVHLSSMSVYGGASGRIMEDTPMVSSDEDNYAGWKSAAEQACLAETGVETVRLRPTIVYGPGGRYWLGHTAKRIVSGHWGLLGAAGDGTCNLVHVADVAGAIAAALSAPLAPGQAFNVNGPETTTWNGYFQALAKAMGRPPLRTITAMELQARIYSALPLKAAAKLRPGLGRDWLLGVPSRSDLGLFASRATYPVDAARDGLRWIPAMGITAGLADFVEWLRSQGLVR